MDAFPGSLRALSRAPERRWRSRTWVGALWLLVAGLAFPALGAAATGEDAAEPEASPALAKRGEGSAWSRLFGRVSDSTPPWAVEAPGAAGARFGLGLDLFSEHQESLRITFMEQSIQTRDLLTGREESEVVRTDPGLLNRKFDFRLDLTGVGVQPAVALPLPRLLGFYPTLMFQAAGADVSLDFRDRNRPEDSSSLSGQGALFGAGLDLTGSLCKSCPWFAGASYFSQRLPNFTVDQSPGFSAPGFGVLEDEVRLSRDVQEVSTRVGYGFSGNRVVSYLGARHRWTDVKIEDHLRYRDPFQETETALDSRTRLESEVTLALAGVEARLGPQLFSRLETSVGGGDWGVLLRVVYLWSGGAPPGEHPGDKDAETVRRLQAIANEIAPRIAEIEAMFLAERKELTVVEGPDGQPAYLVRELEALLGRTERAILAVLNQYPELEAFGDWVQDEFQRARVLGGLGSGSSLDGSAPGAPIEMIVAALGPPYSQGLKGDLRFAQAGGATKNKSQGDKALDSAQQTQKETKQAIAMGLHVQIIFTTTLPEGDVKLDIYPRRNPSAGKGWSPDSHLSRVVPVGNYSWKFDRGQRLGTLICDGNIRGPAVDCPLELTRDPCVKLTCKDNCKARPVTCQ